MKFIVAHWKFMPELVMFNSKYFVCNHVFLVFEIRMKEKSLYQLRKAELTF